MEKDEEKMDLNADKEKEKDERIEPKKMMEVVDRKPSRNIWSEIEGGKEREKKFEEMTKKKSKADVEGREQTSFGLRGAVQRWSAHKYIINFANTFK